MEILIESFFLFRIPPVPTTITQAPKDLTVTQGESGIFHCKARGHPAPHIAWAVGPNGDQPIPSAERFRILPSGSLVIGHVNFTDQGMYRCVASNPAGSATAAATLSMTGKEPVKRKFGVNQTSSFQSVSLALAGFTDVNLGGGKTG